MPEMRREQETDACQGQTGPHPLPHWEAATLRHVFWFHWCDDRDSNWRIFASPCSNPTLYVDIAQPSLSI
jgi:hypothetical protein